MITKVNYCFALGKINGFWKVHIVPKRLIYPTSLKMQLFATIVKLLTIVAKSFIINVIGSILYMVGALSYIKWSCRKEISLRRGRGPESDRHAKTIY